MSAALLCRATVPNPDLGRPWFTRRVPCGKPATHLQFWRSGNGGQTLPLCAECAPTRSCVAPIPSARVEDPDPPEIREPVYGDCHYCGAVFEGTGDDCGGCRLTGEDLERYARDRSVRP